MRINPRFDRNYEFLEKKFKRITITKEEFSILYGISKSNVDLRISNGVNIPNYFKFGSSVNALVKINIIDLTCFMTDIQLDDKDKFDLLYQYLFKKYKRVILTRKILCYELGISLGTLSLKMRKEQDKIPIFQKSKQRNSPIYFSIGDVCDHLLNTVKTM